MNSEARDNAAYRDATGKAQRVRPYIGSAIKLSVTKIDGEGVGFFVRTQHEDHYAALNARMEKLGETMPAVLRAWNSTPKKLHIIGQPV